MTKVKKIKINEATLNKIVAESVKKVLSEVTDYGNNIFGSGNMNPTYKENHGVDRDEYYELRFLRKNIIEKFANPEDENLNYAKDGINIYLYGDIEERQDDLQKIEKYCSEKGVMCDFKNVKYGINNSPVVKITFKK